MSKIFLLIVLILLLFFGCTSEKNNLYESNSEVLVDDETTIENEEDLINSMKNESRGDLNDILDNDKKSEIDDKGHIQDSVLEKLELKDLREIYHMEEDKVLYNVKDVQRAMKKEWDNITGGEPLIIAQIEATPERFSYFSGIKMSPCETKIFFGITHYIVAIDNTLTGVIDINTDEIMFIDNKVKRGAITKRGISWSPDGRNVLYTLSCAAGIKAFYVDNIENGANKLTILDKTLLKEDLEEEQYGKYEPNDWGTFEKIQWNDNNTIKFEMYYKEKNEYVTRVIDINKSGFDKLFYVNN
ncbi:UNVERIFIED_CONTAM: hypothetical protein Cloal_4048 [Acetivibrio alkalicellulosi]